MLASAAFCSPAVCHAGCRACAHACIVIRTPGMRVLASKPEGSAAVRVVVGVEIVVGILVVVVLVVVVVVVVVVGVG